MVATRRSARIASQQSSPPSASSAQTSPSQAAGAKRKSEANSSPSAKRGKKADEKDQKTLEESLDKQEDEHPKPAQSSNNAAHDTEMPDAPKHEAAKSQSDKAPEVVKEPVIEKDATQSRPVERQEHQPEPEPNPQNQEQRQPEEKSDAHQQDSVKAAGPSKGDEQPQTQDKPQVESNEPPKHEQRPLTEFMAQPKPEERQNNESKEQSKPEANSTMGQASKEQINPVSHSSTAPTGQSQPERQSTQGSNVENKPGERSAPESAEPAGQAKLEQFSTSDSKPQSTAEHKPPESKPPQRPESTVTNGTNAVVPGAREAETPSSILEKGVIYFLFRGRVGIDEPSNVGDIARTYIVLRPLPHGAKLGDGPVGDERNCRLLALPKKVLPLSGKDRWTAFVEKAQVSFKDLKDSFMGPSDYATQTAGVRHSPAVVPAAEGIYAITTTGRESHLAYMLTLPRSPGEVQNDLGLKEKGSFVTSVKNPKYPGPAYADIGKDPGYSQEIIDEFRNLRWGPLQPKHLNYENCQFLLVGEGGGVERATQVQDQSQSENKPIEEMQKLEGEDEIRVKHLSGDDAIFADLGTDSKSYAGFQTSW